MPARGKRFVVALLIQRNVPLSDRQHMTPSVNAHLLAMHRPFS